MHKALLILALALRRFLELVLCAAALDLAIACSNPHVAKTPASSSYGLVSPKPVSSVPYEPKKTQIISEPPGARIEVNNNYVGDAPVTVELPQRGDYFSEDTVVRAIPTEGGDYVQIKQFDSNDQWYHPGKTGDKIPSRLFFDMHLGPVNPAIDVKVIPQEQP